MPYIKQELRDTVDEDIKVLSDEISCHCNDDEIEGILNYIITSLLDSVMKNDYENKKWRYKYINRVIGVLECVKLEFYRRLAAPYEDKAKEKNGDIEVYKENIETTEVLGMSFEPEPDRDNQWEGALAETPESAPEKPEKPKVVIFREGTEPPRKR